MNRPFYTAIKILRLSVSNVDPLDRATTLPRAELFQLSKHQHGTIVFPTPYPRALCRSTRASHHTCFQSGFPKSRLNQQKRLFDHSCGRRVDHKTIASRARARTSALFHREKVTRPAGCFDLIQWRVSQDVVFTSLARRKVYVVNPCLRVASRRTIL